MSIVWRTPQPFTGGAPPFLTSWPLWMVYASAPARDRQRGDPGARYTGVRGVQQRTFPQKRLASGENTRTTGSRTGRSQEQNLPLPCARRRNQARIDRLGRPSYRRRRTTGLASYDELPSWSKRAGRTSHPPGGAAPWQRSAKRPPWKAVVPKTADHGTCVVQRASKLVEASR